MSVTVVSCLYGNRGFDRFVSEWSHSVKALDPRPDTVFVFADRHYAIPCAHVLVTDCPWRYPQAFYLQQAIDCVVTDWVWILDIDDQARPDALDGLDDVAADVWVMGYERSDGVRHVPPQLTAAEYLALPGNPFTGASAIRTEAFRRVGGYQDVAFQDWALWRSLARDGATFESSGRANFFYNRHPAARGETELTPNERAEHMAEMLAAEEATVAVH